MFSRGEAERYLAFILFLHSFFNRVQYGLQIFFRFLTPIAMSAVVPFSTLNRLLEIQVDVEAFSPYFLGHMPLNKLLLVGVVFECINPRHNVLLPIQQVKVTLDTRPKL
jgi:hypothetical protein